MADSTNLIFSPGITLSPRSRPTLHVIHLAAHVTDYAIITNPSIAKTAAWAIPSDQILPTCPAPPGTGVGELRRLVDVVGLVPAPPAVISEARNRVVCQHKWGLRGKI